MPHSLRLRVPDSFAVTINRHLKDILGNDAEATHLPLSITDIGREALAVYQWFTEQVKAGRAVAAVDPDLTHFTYVSTPHFPFPIEAGFRASRTP
jgi:hypothetical protein